MLATDPVADIDAISSRWNQFLWWNTSWISNAFEDACKILWQTSIIFIFVDSIKRSAWFVWCPESPSTGKCFKNIINAMTTNSSKIKITCIQHRGQYKVSFRRQQHCCFGLRICLLWFSVFLYYLIPVELDVMMRQIVGETFRRWPVYPLLHYSSSVSSVHKIHGENSVV